MLQAQVVRWTHPKRPETERTCCGSISLGCKAASSTDAASHSRDFRSIARITSCAPPQKLKA